MAVSSVRCLALAALVMTGLLISGNHVSADNCQAIDVKGLTANCIKFVAPMLPKISPSAECCEVVKKLDIPCLCDRVPKGIERMVNLDKVIYVAEKCGIPVHPGDKCGSYTVPPAAA